MKNIKNIVKVSILLLTVGFFLSIFMVIGVLMTRTLKKDPFPPHITGPLSELESYSSREELDSTVEEMGLKLQDKNSNVYAEDTLPLNALSDKESSDAQSITNNQEISVDEGDIVKRHGDILVILRRGRIFTVKISGDKLRVINVVNAYPDGFTQSTWIDEMLISDNTVVVIGYSYMISATQVSLFEITDGGGISHMNTYFISSNDYYSSRNYASRIVDGKLVFYMPYMFLTSKERETSKYSVPVVRTWLADNQLSEGVEILDYHDIYKPIQNFRYPYLHTVVMCNFDNGFSCNAKAVLAGYSRNFYVSENAIYVWVSGVNNDVGLLSEYLQSADESTDSCLYRFDINDFSTSAVRTYGTPIDQFSFKERDDKLYVLVSDNSFGDGMWGPEFEKSGFALLALDIDNFGGSPLSAGENKYTYIGGDTYNLQNRYIGDMLLVGGYDSQLAYINYVNPSLTDGAQFVDTDYFVSRIEAIGENAVIIGGGNRTIWPHTKLGNNTEEVLYVTSWKVSDYGVNEVSRLTYPGKYQEESRSHGFFYSSALQVFGLPVSGSYYNNYSGAGDILYVKVRSNLSLLEIGEIDSTVGTNISDGCKYSCIDWYGEARPIFIDDNIYALMGYELVKASLGVKVNEIDRIDLQQSIRNTPTPEPFLD